MNPAGLPAGRIAIFPGSFDPLTNGHVDIILRSAHLFERIVVAVLVNADKRPLFTAEERIAIIRDVFREYPNVEVETFDGLTVELCRARGAGWIVRGLRAISDFEAEIQFAHNNRRLAPEVDTVFLMTSLEQGYVSSSLVKEIAALGGESPPMTIRAFAPNSSGAPALHLPVHPTAGAWNERAFSWRCCGEQIHAGDAVMLAFGGTVADFQAADLELLVVRQTDQHRVAGREIVALHAAMHGGEAPGLGADDAAQGHEGDALLRRQESGVDGGAGGLQQPDGAVADGALGRPRGRLQIRSEEHTSELQSH